MLSLNISRQVKGHSWSGFPAQGHLSKEWWLMLCQPRSETWKIDKWSKWIFYNTAKNCPHKVRNHDSELKNNLDEMANKTSVWAVFKMHVRIFTFQISLKWQGVICLRNQERSWHKLFLKCYLGSIWYLRTAFRKLKIFVVPNQLGLQSWLLLFLGYLTVSWVILGSCHSVTTCILMTPSWHSLTPIKMIMLLKRV